MKTISESARWILGTCAATMLFAGCAGPPAQSPLPGPIGPIGQNAPSGVTPDHTGSWMDPVAKHDDLVYVSDTASNAVWVYGLRTHKLVGMLAGIAQPWGLCADQSGNVWIVGWKRSQLWEYAHAGIKPLQILTVHDPEASLIDCSVDPTTGNLAVTNWGYDWYKGYVLIYPHGWGKPTIYTGPRLWYYYGCTYDDRGNLFAEGWDAYLDDIFALAKLPKGGTTFKNISLLPNPNPILLGGIRWDGRYVTIEDAGYLYKYTVSGHYAYYRGFVSLTAHWPPMGIFWITNLGGKEQIIAPDYAGGRVAVQYWNYPAGGKPTATITGHLDEPWGVTVSLAPR